MRQHSLSNRSLMHQGIWGGMIFGGTFVQTVILAIITARCDWEKEAGIAKQRLQKWSNPNPDDKRADRS
ncbi:hypothetical protein CUMW_060300 [Citrus unshiu]|uniref:Protein DETOXIFICATION n=1 Tax=Citrus unshiu TaxID=55188 RepID=A0A2H5NMY1_CITUN|nr:hypothetical protein CUMW_060300 [Citrus unshiu]